MFVCIFTMSLYIYYEFLDTYLVYNYVVAVVSVYYTLYYIEYVCVYKIVV